MSETTVALEKLFDAGSREGQLLAYRKCLEIVRQTAFDENTWTAPDVMTLLIQEQIALLEAQAEKTSEKTPT